MTEVETQSTDLPLPPTSLSKTHVSMFHCFVTVGVLVSHSVQHHTLSNYPDLQMFYPHLNSGHSSVTVSSTNTAADGSQQSLGKISPPRSCTLTADSVPNRIDWLILPPVSGRGHPYITSEGFHRSIPSPSPGVRLCHL